MQACKMKNIPVIRSLLHNGADPNLKDEVRINHINYYNIYDGGFIWQTCIFVRMDLLVFTTKKCLNLKKLFCSCFNIKLILT